MIEKRVKLKSLPVR